MAQTTTGSGIKVTKLELTGIKWIMARFASKCPQYDALLLKVCGIAFGAALIFTGLYNSGEITHSAIMVTISGWANVICYAAPLLGIKAAFGTTDPTLLSGETIDNINATPTTGTDIKQNVLDNQKKTQ